MLDTEAICAQCHRKLKSIVHMNSIAGEAACEFYPMDRKTWLELRAEGFERPEPTKEPSSTAP